MVLSMDRWVGKVAVVTGASAGIGAAITEQLVEKGLKVAAVARNQDRLDQLAKKLTDKLGELHPIKADLTKEEDILNAFKWIKENLGPVHILINNAGVLQKGLLTDGDSEAWGRVFRVNAIALCVATREAVRDMRANNVDGHIIHINSIAGHQVSVLPVNIYSASKFAVRALAETLRLELNGLKTKIKITNLSPGFVNTEMLPIDQSKREEHYRGGQIIDAEDVADGVIYALSTPPHVQIQELIIRPILQYSP